MADFITTTIHVKGIAKAPFYTDGDFDLDKLIPSPRDEKDYDAQKYGDTRGVQIEEDRPWFNGYNWNRENWGTKWNACETTIIDDDTVSFETPWNPPFPVLQAISEYFKDEEMEVSAKYWDDSVTKFWSIDGGVFKIEEYGPDGELERSEEFSSD